MNLKQGGLLYKIVTQKSAEGMCSTCGNLIKVSDSALGCTAHDKLIMPEFIPYSGKDICKDWEVRK